MKLDFRLMDRMVMNPSFLEKLKAQMKEGEPPTLVGEVMGIKLFESTYMPDDMAICQDRDGNVIGIIDGRGKKE